MEKFSVTERFLAVCCTKSFTSLFLRTFRTAGFVAWLFSHDFLFATHPSGCTLLRPFSFISCQFRHCIFYTFQFCCGLHSEYTTTGNSTKLNSVMKIMKLRHKIRSEHYSYRNYLRRKCRITNNSALNDKQG